MDSPSNIFDALNHRFVGVGCSAQWSLGRFGIHHGCHWDDGTFTCLCGLVPIHLQEEGTGSMARPMGDAGKISKTGVSSLPSHHGTGLGLGQSSAAISSRADRFSPDSRRALDGIAIHLCLPRIGPTQGRLSLPPSRLPELEREGGITLHRTESKMIRALVPTMSSMSRHVFSR